MLTSCMLKDSSRMLFWRTLRLLNHSGLPCVMHCGSVFSMQKKSKVSICSHLLIPVPVFLGCNVDVWHVRKGVLGENGENAPSGEFFTLTNLLSMMFFGFFVDVIVPSS